MASIIAVVAERPDKRPGNLAPIQLITAFGAWSLIVVDSVIVALACRTGVPALAIAPVATILCAAIAFARSSASERSARSLPEPFTAVITEIRDLLGGARRLGLDQIDAVLGSSGGPWIGVSAPARGRVVVRVHESVAAWIDRHLRRGGAGAATIGSFIRFAVLHELGHILNGDHRTYRFARAVVVAHIWWCTSFIVAALSWTSGHAADARVILTAAAFVGLLLAVQSLIARRFIAERERLADWRAMQSLSSADAERLLRRSGIRRGGRDGPAEIEKLMIDLKAQPGAAGIRSFVSRAVCMIWPEGDSVHRRAEALAGERAGAPPRPVQWAILTGLQCGVLATAVATGILLVIGTRIATTVYVYMIAISWIAGPGGVYAAIRADSARMSVGGGTPARKRLGIGCVFFLTLLFAAFATDRLAYSISVAAFVPGPVLLVALMPTAVVIIYSAVAGELIRDNGGGELRIAPRARRTAVASLLAAIAVVCVPLNMAFAFWLGLGNPLQGAWVAIMVCAFGAYLLSTVSARSPHPIFRAAAPLAFLVPIPPVYTIRFLWRNFCLDVARHSMARARALIIASQAASLLLFVVPVALAMRIVVHFLDYQTTFTRFFWSGVGLFVVAALVPDHSTRFGLRLMRLVESDQLKLFLALLDSARHADAAAARRLESALVRWMSDDRLVLAVLPDRWTLWPLLPLSTLVRLARSAGADSLLDHMRGHIEQALRLIINDDAVSGAPGEPPSLFYSTMAATIVDEAGLIDRFPLDRMLDRIEAMLRDQMAGRGVDLVTDIIAAARLLQAHGRTPPSISKLDAFERRWTLISKPVRHQSLVELCELADLLEDASATERLVPIVRSRMWEILQLNARKEVLALLDCYLAAVHLGEGDSSLASAAAVTIAEIANRTTNELTTI